MKSLYCAVFVTFIASTVPAQDLNSLRGLHASLAPAPGVVWVHTPGNGASAATFEVQDGVSPAQVINLPLTRLNAFALEAGASANEWYLLVAGAYNDVSLGGVLPTCSGRISVVRVTRDAVTGLYSTVVAAQEDYSDIHPYHIVLTGGGIHVVDYVTGDVWQASGFSMIPSGGSGPSVPPRAAFALLSSALGGPVWRGVPQLVMHNRAFGPNESWSLVSLAEPRSLELFTLSGSGWSSAIADTLSQAQNGEVLVRDCGFVSQSVPMQVRVAASGSSAPIEVRDPSGSVLYSATIAANQWVSLPTIAALRDQPGLPHRVASASSGSDVIPMARYGGAHSQRVGVDISRVVLSQAFVNHEITHGVRVGVSSSVPAQSFGLYVLYAVRDVNGQDPVVPYGTSGDYLLDTDVMVAYGDVELNRVCGSLGLVDVFDDDLEGQVLLMQYVILFNDGQLAYSDVVGVKVQQDPDLDALAMQSSSMGSLVQSTGSASQSLAPIAALRSALPSSALATPAQVGVLRAAF